MFCVLKRELLIFFKEVEKKKREKKTLYTSVIALSSADFYTINGYFLNEIRKHMLLEKTK